MCPTSSLDARTITGWSGQPHRCVVMSPDRSHSAHVANVVTPTDGLDPRIALASSIHASPGGYAVLVGEWALDSRRH